MEIVEFLVHEDFTPNLLKRFEKEMNAVTNPCMIVLDIESGGGYTDVFKSMYEIIKDKKEQGFVFLTNVNKYAYSAAFMLMASGDIKVIDPKAELMYHSSGIVINDERLTSEDARQIYETLAIDDAFTKDVLFENTNISEATYSLLKKNETYLNKDDLENLGIIEKLEEYQFN